MTIEPDRQDHDRLSRMVQLPASVAEVWAVIGDFHGVADWHPLIASCEPAEIDGETYRHLVLDDGGKVFERLLETGPNFYTYEIIDGPLPVSDYRATISVVEEDEGCHVYWSAYFVPTAPDQHKSDEMVAKVYEVGLEALRERFG